MKSLIEKYKLPTIQEANNKIVALNNVDELRRLELEYKNSDNYRLEFERDIKMKEADLKIKELEINIRLKELDLEIEIERNK